MTSFALQTQCIMKIEDADKTYFHIDVGDEHVKKIERHRLSIGLALNKLLKEYREIT